MNKKIVFGLWVIFALGLITLLAAGRSARTNAVCPDFKITIEGKNNQVFIDEKEIIRIAKNNGIVKGVPLKQINLQKIESALESNPWISHAKLYFDDQNNLCASIWESEPIARVFTLDGRSFYVDSATRRLPLHSSVITRLPVFTSFASGMGKMSSPDSNVLADVKKIAQYVAVDTFWNAFISEVDINTDHTFDILPTLGNTVISLGNADSLPEKFDRIYSFYKQVWTKTGFNRYEKIDVRYSNQVVATRRGGQDAQLKDTATLNAIAGTRKYIAKKVIASPEVKKSAIIKQKEKIKITKNKP